MANRPVFIPTEKEAGFVLTRSIEFKWFAGMSVSQKQKSVSSLHQAAYKHNDVQKLLEVSSKSTENIGLKLSAFNLLLQVNEHDAPLSVECAFQGSKVFERGGPYVDLYNKSSLVAKKDNRIHESGRLLSFKFFDVDWSLEPKTSFYDWLYITALNEQPDELKRQLREYDGFTDIEFNPKKSINCQAYSVALYVALDKHKLLEKSMQNKETFLQQMKEATIANDKEHPSVQGKLF